MALEQQTVLEILKIKQKDETLRLSRVGRKPKKGEVLLSNRDIAEMVLGTRSAESTVRRIWAEYKKKGHYRGTQLEGGIASGTIHVKQAKRTRLKGKKFVITSAQNNTLVHEDFFQSLLGYCEHNDAQLLVSGFHYNKNGFQNGKREDSWFDERLVPYMVNESVELADGLVFCGELNILPSAVNPISGLHNYTGENSAIIPHAKLQLESVPTPQSDVAKLIYTTGTVTQRNYVQQKAGQKAEWHHAFAALVVEVDNDGDWFVRQLNCESATGVFYDLLNKYTPKGCDKHEWSITGVQFGDIHADKLRQEVADMCWNNEDSIGKVLSPQYIFLHDLHDHARRNHHNIKDPYYLFKQFNKGKECVQTEVRNTLNLLQDIKQACEEVVIVESNHDLALERWLKEQDYRKDPVNAVFFLEMQTANYRAMSEGKELQTFKTACSMVSDKGEMERLRFLKTDEKFRVHGIEMGQHGHNGTGGSRGSLNAFVKQGIRFNIGHSHNPNIKDGVYQAGACVLPEDSGYAVGGCSWSISHIITYGNGKRTIITCKNGKWRG